MGRNVSRNDRTDERPKKVCPKVKTHPKASLMHEHHISDNHWHDTLIRTSSKTTDNSSPDKACIARGKCLPNVRQYANQPTYQNCRTPPKDVAERYNDEIRVSECNGCSSEQIIDLRESFVEFLHENWRKRSNGQGCENADEDEECLVDDHCCFPSRAPILSPKN
jgi:hypothetical protein